ncbi:MAG: hypothetical protein ACT4QA_23650 [Panacagrimonas sp.]
MNLAYLKNIFPRLIRARPAYVTLIVVPLAILAVYFGVIASDRYVADARIIVEHDSAIAAAGLDLGLLSLAGGGSSAKDIELVKRFIESPAMLDYLDKTLGFRQHYAGSGSDWFSRLADDASREDALEYYLDLVEIEVDEDSLTLDVVAEANSPSFAQQMAAAMVQRSEQFVNEVGQSLAREQVAFVQNEVDKAHAKVQQTASALIEYQNQHSLFSPELENQAVSQVILGLQQELARQRTEQKALQSYLSAAAPEVVGVQKKISALERQISQERSKQVSIGKSEALNDLLVRYKELELSLQVATDIYQTGLKSLEAAKLDASRKVKHLVMVSAPTLPEESTRPRRLYSWFTAFALLHVAYLIGGIIVSIIKDHRE